MNGSGDLKAFGKPGPSPKVEYLVIDNGGGYPEDARLLDINFGAAPFEDWELEDMAQEAAEHDFSHHCGYERYPSGSDAGAFELFVDGKSVGVFDVTVESVPSFSARKHRATSSEVPL